MAVAICEVTMHTRANIFSNMTGFITLTKDITYGQVSQWDSLGFK
jgi:hypothetical protein